MKDTLYRCNENFAAFVSCIERRRMRKYVYVTVLQYDFGNMAGIMSESARKVTVLQSR